MAVLDNIVQGSTITIEIAVRTGTFNVPVLVNVQTVTIQLFDGMGVTPPGFNAAPMTNNGTGVYSIVIPASTTAIANLGVWTAYFTATDANGNISISPLMNLFNLIAVGQP